MQQFPGRDLKGLSEFPNDFQTRVKRALLQLAEVAPTDFRLIREIVLRHAPRMAQPPQIPGENFPQIHAESRPGCSIWTPRYIKQNAVRMRFTLSCRVGNSGQKGKARPLAGDRGIFSTHHIAVLADLATFLVVGWLSLRILHKFENDFPMAGKVGFFSLFLLFYVVILAVVLVNYFIEGRHDWEEIRFGFGYVWLVLFLGSTFVINYVVQAFIPNRAWIQNVVTGLFVLAAFAFSVWAFWQIFGI
jgi:hypothetical protein